MAENKIKINRAPVMTLWAVVVAERLGYTPEEALTLGKSVSGLNAQSKGRRLGIYEEKDEEERPRQPQKGEGEKTELVEILGRGVPTVKTKEGLRATEDGRPIDPRSVQRYLERKFGENLPLVQEAMQALAKSYEPKELASKAFGLYAKFRPEVPEGTRGWGAQGELNLEKIHEMVKSST